MTTGGAAPNPCWVAGVCRANIAVINYGAHATGVDRFKTDMKTVRNKHLSLLLSIFFCLEHILF